MNDRWTDGGGRRIQKWRKDAETMEGIHDQLGKSQASCEDQREQGESPVSNTGERSALLEELLRFSN